MYNQPFNARTSLFIHIVTSKTEYGMLRHKVLNYLIRVVFPLLDI